MRSILAITLLSFKEGLRQRVLYGMGLFALATMFFAVMISGLFMRDIAKVTIDFSLAAVNLAGLLVPFFLAVNMLARDLERRTVFSILSQPLSRSDYIIGKFGGLLLLTSTVVIILALGAFAAIYGSKLLYGPHYFTTLSWLALVQAVFLGLLGLIMLDAVVILWSCLTTSSFLVTLLTLATFIVGHSLADLVRFLASQASGASALLLAKFLGIIQYVFPNLAAFDYKLAAAHGLVVPAAETGLLVLYAGAYITAALCLAIFLFKRRDLL
jgi:ABC-type transport system involved in multi-copper enzyme maturation permease subunit